MRIFLLALSLFMILPTMAQDVDYYIDANYRLFIEDTEGLVNVVDLTLMDGRATAFVPYFFNAGQSVEVSGDAGYYASIYPDHDNEYLWLIETKETHETEKPLSSIWVVSLTPPSILFNARNELAVLTDRETESLFAWYIDGEEHLATLLPNVGCVLEDVYQENALVHCGDSWYLVTEDGFSQIQSTSNIIAGYLCYGIFACLTERQGDVYKLSSYMITGLSVASEAYAIVSLGTDVRVPLMTEHSLVIQKANGNLYMGEDENRFAYAVDNFTSSTDTSVFWLNNLDYALHVRDYNGVIYSAGLLGFNSERILRVVRN